MITYMTGSLFTSSAQTLVNTVNTVGVMGKGIAKTFKAIYPEMYVDYRQKCEQGELVPGRLLLYRTPHKWILNFPTKRHWRQPSRLEDIDAGLTTFRQTYAEQGVTSIAFPQLGCGHGGLDWESQVRPLMERHLGSLALRVVIHISSTVTSAPDEPSESEITEWLRADVGALPFAEFWRDLHALSEMQSGTGRNHSIDRSELPVNYAEGSSLVHRDDMFDLWQSLRTQGYLTPDHIESVVGIPGAAVVALLAKLPYVTRTSVASLPPNIRYDARLTCELLEAPEAQGVRLVPSRFAERHPPSLADVDEDRGRWNVSQMTMQLAHSSTS